MGIEVCAPGSKRRMAGLVHFRDGGARCCFNYTQHLDQLMRSWCSRYPALSHIDMDRVVLSVVKCRTENGHGVYANITSLRYPLGPRKRASSEIYRWPKIVKNGCEALYLIRFFLPRFHNLSYDGKVATILHELYHIDPKFNGEFRNFGGKRWAHGPSQRAYEDMYSTLKGSILESSDPVCDFFLNCRFAALLRRVGDIYGDRYAAISPMSKMPIVT